MRYIPRKELVALLEKYTAEDELIGNGVTDALFNRYGDDWLVVDGVWQLVNKNKLRTDVLQNIHRG